MRITATFIDDTAIQERKVLVGVPDNFALGAADFHEDLEKVLPVGLPGLGLHLHCVLGNGHEELLYGRLPRRETEQLRKLRMDYLHQLVAGLSPAGSEQLSQDLEFNWIYP